MNESLTEAGDIGDRAKPRARRQVEFAKLREQRLELMKTKREAIKASFVGKRRRKDEDVRVTRRGAPVRHGESYNQ